VHRKTFCQQQRQRYNEVGKHLLKQWYNFLAGRGATPKHCICSGLLSKTAAWAAVLLLCT
jgi:hypothetical protein